MDISNFLGGSFLTAADLPSHPVVWTISGVSQQMVGNDQKICITFREHPKSLGLNKTNLRTLADAFGTQSQAWIGRSVEVFRDTTFFQGRQTPCVRLRIPAAPQPAPVAQQTTANQQPIAAQAVQPPQQKGGTGPVWGGL